MKELCGVGNGGIVGSGEMEGLCGVGGCGNCVGWWDGGSVWQRQLLVHCPHWKVDFWLHLVSLHPRRATSEVHHGKGQIEANVGYPSKQQRNWSGGKGRGRGIPTSSPPWLQ